MHDLRNIPSVVHELRAQIGRVGGAGAVLAVLVGSANGDASGGIVLAARGTAWLCSASRGATSQDEELFMRTAVATLRSISPYSQSKFYDTPKEMRGATVTESAKDYEARTWRDRMHVTGKGEVFIPPMAFKNCLSEIAKYLSVQIPGKGKSTYTKHFEAGVMVIDPLVLPLKKDDAKGEWLFVPADGKRGSGKRVQKCFPVIHEWSGDVTFHVLDDVITPEVFEQHLKDAGSFIGIGRFRPRNNGFYGRFAVEKVKWS